MSTRFPSIYLCLFHFFFSVSHFSENRSFTSLVKFISRYSLWCNCQWDSTNCLWWSDRWYSENNDSTDKRHLITAKEKERDSNMVILHLILNVEWVEADLVNTWGKDILRKGNCMFLSRGKHSDLCFRSIAMVIWRKEKG